MTAPLPEEIDEPAHCPDIFATDLIALERLPGKNLRFTYGVRQGDGVIVVCRLVRPECAVGATIEQIRDLLAPAAV